MTLFIKNKYILILKYGILRLIGCFLINFFVGIKSRKAILP